MQFENTSGPNWKQIFIRKFNSSVRQELHLIVLSNKRRSPEMSEKLKKVFKIINTEKLFSSCSHATQGLSKKSKSQAHNFAVTAVFNLQLGWLSIPFTITPILLPFTLLNFWNQTVFKIILPSFRSNRTTLPLVLVDIATSHHVRRIGSA